MYIKNKDKRYGTVIIKHRKNKEFLDKIILNKYF